MMRDTLRRCRVPGGVPGRPDLSHRALPPSGRHGHGASRPRHPRARPAERLLLGAALAVGAALAGCSDPPPPPPPVATAPAAPVPVDGNYGGMMQTIRGSAMTCGTQDMFRLTVANNSFRYVLNQGMVPWKPQRVFDAVIAPDGTFQSAAGDTYIRGRLSQGHMSGEIVGDACGYRFEADHGAVF